MSIPMPNRDLDADRRTGLHTLVGAFGQRRSRDWVVAKCGSVLGSFAAEDPAGP